MQVDETEFVVRTNFDELDAQNCCWVSLRFLRGPRRPRQGEWIQLRDERGAACMACVQDVHGWTARVAPDWNTCTGDVVPRLARESYRRLREV
jgi:hypothetical protein